MSNVCLKNKVSKGLGGWLRKMADFCRISVLFLLSLVHLRGPVIQPNWRLTFEDDLRQEVCYTSLHSDPASALSSLTVWSHWGNPGLARCQEMATLPTGYILQRKVPSASSSGSLGHCVCAVLQDGCQCTNQAYYLYPVANSVRPSVDPGEMITPAQELGTPVAQGLGLTPLIGDCHDTVCYKQTNKTNTI